MHDCLHVEMERRTEVRKIRSRDSFFGREGEPICSSKIDEVARAGDYIPALLRAMGEGGPICSSEIDEVARAGGNIPALLRAMGAKCTSWCKSEKLTKRIMGKESLMIAKDAKTPMCNKSTYDAWTTAILVVLLK